MSGLCELGFKGGDRMTMKYHELVRKCQNKGFDIRSGINPRYVKMVRATLAIYGKNVSEAIRDGRAKDAVRLLKSAKDCKATHLKFMDEANAIVYDRSGKSILEYEKSTGKLYQLVH
jgi:hypothetical protein